MIAATSDAEPIAILKNLFLSFGNGRFSVKERNRFFDISLGSIAEVASAFDFTSAYGYISANELMYLKNELRASYAMIRKLKK